jgi:isopentenyldiphosphate isomerase
MPELLEVRTASGAPTGVTKSREAIHADGDWHLAAFVWVFDSAGRILLQRRSMNKDAWPGRWDASAAGHVAAGESAVEAAARELAEEIGLTVRAEDLVPAGAHREEHVHASGMVDREHHAVFLLRSELSLEAYRPGLEVTALVFAPADALVALHTGRAPSIAVETREGGKTMLRSDEIVPYEPEYIARIARLVNEALA